MKIKTKKKQVGAKLGFDKLREWVWTETGKGDRWEGDR